MAVEIKVKNKYRLAGAGKKQKGGHNNQGSKHANRRDHPKGELEAAQAATRANQRVMVLLPNMKRRFMTVGQWEKMRDDRQ